MKEFIRKGMLFGMGLATATKEKIEETVEEMIKKGEMTEKEGKDAVDDLVKKSKEMKQDLRDKVEQIVADTLKTLNVPTRDEFVDLKDRIARLEDSQKQKD